MKLVAKVDIQAAQQKKNTVRMIVFGFLTLFLPMLKRRVISLFMKKLCLMQIKGKIQYLVI